MINHKLSQYWNYTGSMISVSINVFLQTFKCSDKIFKKDAKLTQSLFTWNSKTLGPLFTQLFFDASDNSA